MIFQTAWHNGEIVSLDRLPVDMPWEPWGERGRGVFTTTRSRLDHRRLAFWPPHRTRLLDTLQAIGLDGERFRLPTEEGLVAWVESLGAGDVCLRINVMESAVGDTEVWAVARPLPITPIPTRLGFSSEPVAPDRGLKLVAQRWRRRATDLAAAKGVWDVVDVIPDGPIVDGSRSNILARIGDRWVGAWVEGITLPGTVASALIDHGVVQRGTITRGDVDTASEVVAVNSVRGVVPIHEVEGREFKSGNATEDIRRWVEAEAVAHARGES